MQIFTNTLVLILLLIVAIYAILNWAKMFSCVELIEEALEKDTIPDKNLFQKSLRITMTLFYLSAAIIVLLTILNLTYQNHA